MLTDKNPSYRDDIKLLKIGELNVSKRPEVKEKISKSWSEFSDEKLQYIKDKTRETCT
jgi:hypothetical protein